MKKREYSKPQVKIHIPHLEHMICNGTNGEETEDPWEFNSLGPNDPDDPILLGGKGNNVWGDSEY